MSAAKRRWIYVFVSLAIVFLYCGALVPVSAWAIGEPGIDAGMETFDDLVASDGGHDYDVSLTIADITLVSAPSDQTVCVGDKVTWVFDVECSGSVTYKLERKDNADGAWRVVDEGTSGRYSFIATDADDGARFYWTASSSSDNLSVGPWTVTVVTASEPTPSPTPDTDPSPTPTPDPDQTPDAEPTPTPEITPAPAVDATIWDKPFETYNPTEGLLLILVVLAFTAGTVKLFGRFW